MLKIDSICLADNPNIILILLLDKLKMQTTDQEEPSPLYTFPSVYHNFIPNKKIAAINRNNF